MAVSLTTIEECRAHVQAVEVEARASWCASPLGNAPNMPYDLWLELAQCMDEAIEILRSLEDSTGI